MKPLIKMAVPLLLLISCSSGGVSRESGKLPAGNPDGAVLVVEFSDLQCPACKAAHASIIPELLRKHGDVVRLEWRHFPLQYHRYALSAAQASECSADQGKFWEYVNVVFENQEELSPRALVEWAGRLGLDGDLFEKCWKSGAKKNIALDDYKQGKEMGVKGTPTFFVDGEKIPSDQLVEAVGMRMEQFKQKL